MAEAKRRVADAGVEAGDDDDRGPLPALGDMADDLDAVAIAKRQIHGDRVVGAAAQGVEGLLQGAHGVDMESPATADLADQQALGAVVVDDEQAACGFGLGNG